MITNLMFSQQIFVDENFKTYTVDVKDTASSVIAKTLPDNE